MCYHGHKEVMKLKGNASGGAFYGIGFIGALIYFLQHATSFVDGVVGVVMAIFWPGVFAYKIFEFFGM